MHKNYTEIPHNMIAEGILLSIANCKRYVNDAQLLSLNAGLQTALLCLFLAAEELAKANLLFLHFLRDEPVPVEQVRQYFKSHELKFEEYHKFLHEHSFLPIELTPEMLEKIRKKRAYSEQNYKERMMYVDWIDTRWHDPLQNADFAFAAIADNDEWLKMRIIEFALSLKTQIFNFEHGFDYPKIRAAPIIDVPTELKVWQILKEYVAPNTSAVVQVIDKRIDVKIHPNAPLILKKELKQSLCQRFSEYEICIEISKQGFKRSW